jgi:uncharacterized Zn ribbon protein
MDKKSIIKALKELFSGETEVKLNFLDVKTGDGRILRVTDVALEGIVKEVTEEGEIDVEDGTYVLEDGISLVVVGGIITEVLEPAQEDMESDKEGETKTKFQEVLKLKDGTEITIDNVVEGEMNLGDALILNGEPAPVGEYVLEDGRILVVDEKGLLIELKPAVEEEYDESDEKDIIGVVANLKDLISQVKDLKSKFESVDKENKELKEMFSKIPSETKTSNKIDFSSDVETRFKSPLHDIINKK